MFESLCWNPWDDDHLISLYEENIVPKEMKQEWAIEAISDGMEISEVEELIWKNYPDWAWDRMCSKYEDHE